MIYFKHQKQIRKREKQADRLAFVIALIFLLLTCVI